MAKYYGSKCKGGCEGHKAGARYVRKGGRLMTNRSASFNRGMRVAQRHLKNKGIASRLRTPK